ncbi:hypothetical protein CERSUDRAFT_120141 [Gelatoporia subvermispora B]|uniref:Uncharacterized protein n=1 Tax=Ceriporiopsis subvermispora (strain B) TaxID=914234 RepID=M2Q2Q9_CERS8|nr:hypothetical protein CERSUDRAFT_120141 [Gelatoporia subvermispora B]
MTSKAFHAYAVYADQLYSLGHGMPLWLPEPTQQEGELPEPEVQIGDVGYLHKGGFFRLFNISRPLGDPLNRRGCPGGPSYQSFQLNTTATYDLPNAIPPGSLYSRSMKEISVGAGAAVPAAGGAFQYQYSGGQGAIIVLQDSAKSKELHESRRLVNHIRQNFEHWYQFVTEELDRDLQREELIVVRGWVKTTHWAVAAFAEGGHSGSLTFNTNFAIPASVSLNINVSANVAVCKQHRISTNHREQSTQTLPMLTGSESSLHSLEGGEISANQCIFLHYYKVKLRRFWRWRPIDIKAEAEPRDDFGHPDDGTMHPVAADSPVASTIMDIESVPERSHVRDPVEDVLDYILRNSEAQVAIAHDGHVYQLCRKLGVDVPQDFASLIQTAAPDVEVNEDGLGILSLEGFELRAPGIELPTEPVDVLMAEVPLVEEQDTGPATEAPGMSTAGPHTEQIMLEDPQATQPTEALEFVEGPPLEEISHPVAGTSSTNVDLPEGPAAGPSGARVTDAPRAKKREMFLLLGHEGSVVCCDVSADGRYIASGSEDSTVRIWDATDSSPIHTCERGTQTIFELMFHPTRAELLISSTDGSVVVLNIETGAIRVILDEHEGNVCPAVYSPDGRVIACVSADNHILIWHAETGDKLADLPGHVAVVLCLVFSADSRRLISGSGDHIACIWDVIAGEAINVLTDHEEVVTCAAFSPDGDRVITGSDDGTARIWKVDTGDELVILGEHTGPIHFVAFSPDGRRVLTAADDGFIKKFDAWGEGRIHSLEDSEQTVTSVAVSPDGTRICAGVGGHMVKVWDADMNLLVEFEGHADKINKVKFMASGNRVVSASDDRSVRVWEIEA